MKSRLISLLKLLFFFILTTSCERTVDKSEEVAQKTQQVLKEQSKKIKDKVYPAFDSDKPDTENNKNRFKDFLKVELTPDVKNIYCFEDVIGIDSDYMFAFNCDSITAKRIIGVNNLSIDTTNNGNAFSLQTDFKWWDKERIAQLDKYSWSDGKQYFKYFWYDNENNKAYFFDFDL